MTRRSLTASSWAGGATLAVAGCGGGHPAHSQRTRANPTNGTSKPPAPNASAITYFEDSTLNLQPLFALGSAGYGISEPGALGGGVDSAARVVLTYSCDGGRRWAPTRVISGDLSTTHMADRFHSTLTSDAHGQFRDGVSRQTGGSDARP